MPIDAELVIPGMFFPELRALREAIFDRVLPAFDDIGTLAERTQQETYERLSARAGEDADGADLAQAATDAGLEYYETMYAARQAVLNTLAVGLAHLFEQQRYLLTYRTLGDAEPDEKKRERRFREFLEARKIDGDSFRRGRLQELRLVANVAKHGEGRSAERLRLLCPDLFTHPAVRDHRLRLGPPEQVNRTLMGDDLFVQPDDLLDYLDAVESFWRHVLNRVATLPDER